MKPSHAFIKQFVPSVDETIDDTSGLIDYVDFGTEANAFILAVGVLHSLSVQVLAELLIERQETYLSNLTNDVNIHKKLRVYKECLKKIAIASTDTPELYRNPLKTRLTNERWCFGIQLNNDNKNFTYRIVKPTEIYLDDDHQ
ncbi:unnamed protein product, partial [Rotaria socialis]